MNDSNEKFKKGDKILYVNPSTGSADLTLDPNNPDIIYIFC